MTICAAVINGRGIIAVQDMKLTFFGGSISSEGVAWKQRKVHRNWEVLFSGDISTLTPMLEAIEEECRKSKEKQLRHFARLCAHAYRKERERIIEDEVLPDYDISTYAEYLALKTADPTLFDAVGTKISEAEEGWHLLFCGFDHKKKPHLFVISGRGKIQYCDTQGFAAVGSGAWAASVALASYPYRASLSKEEAAYCLLAAKFSAESAEGVGQETILHLSRYEQSWSSFMFDPHISEVREKWRTLPRIPEHAAAEIKVELDKNEGLLARAKKNSRESKKKKVGLASLVPPAQLPEPEKSK